MTVTARSYGRLVAQAPRGGALVPVAGASVRVYDAGTSTPYAGVLYADADTVTPLGFPALCDAAGTLELWSETPVRLDAEASSVADGTVRATIDLEPAPFAAGETGSGAVDSVNGHTGAVVLTAADVGALTTAGANALYEPLDSAYTKSESDARYTQGGITQTTADTRYLQLSGGTLTGAVTGTALTLSGAFTRGSTAQPTITVASSAPGSPATGDLWVW